MALKSKLKKTFFGLLIFFVSLGLLVPWLSRGYITEYALKEANRLLNTKVTIASADLQLLTASLTIRELKVYHPEHQNETFLTIKKLKASLRYIPYLFGKTGSLLVKLYEPDFTYATTRTGVWELQDKIPFFRKGEGEARLPLNIEAVVIKNGAVRYVDRKISKQPTVTRANKINFKITEVRLKNADEKLPSHFTLSALLNEHAPLKVEGRGDFLSPKISFEADLSLAGLAVPPFEPYFQSPKIPVHITQAYATMVSRGLCQDNWLKAPANMTVTQLRVQPKRNNLLGVPAQAVVNHVEKKGKQLNFNMLVQGDIRNPRFLMTSDLSQEFIDSFTKGLGEGLGGTVEKVGEGVKKGFEKLKGIFNKH